MAIFARLLRGRVRITKIAATALARAYHRSMRPLAFYLQRFLSIPIGPNLSLLVRSPRRLPSLAYTGGA